MPLYEYRCLKNEHRFEVIQKFADAPLEKCIHCDGEVEKLISTSNFHLKGGGWYATDYGKGKTACNSGGCEEKNASTKTAEACCSQNGTTCPCAD